MTNALVSDADLGEPGIPYHVALRGVLDAENISDAYAVLQRGFRSSSANYLIAAADGLAVDIEGMPGDFDRLFPSFPTDGVLLHTNHFRSERLHRSRRRTVAHARQPFPAGPARRTDRR